MSDTSHTSAWPAGARIIQVRGSAASPWMRRVVVVLDLRREAERTANLRANGYGAAPVRTDATSAWDGELLR